MIGKKFGNYLVVSVLGQGGMGTVYLAENPSIGRRVAIKVLREDMTVDPQVTQRFLNEARAANSIHHPNIIEVVDGGTSEDGQPYLVMELLLGEELSHRIKRMRVLPIQNALEIAYQTSSALGAAHKQGIIHRDLKPDNLFLVPDALDPSIERVKVLDFGIAKLQSAVKQPMVKTQTGALMGTPVYMSPEQCLGTKEIDARSDIYSLGCILFEMLAGRPPFMSEGVGELIVMHINTPPRPITEFNPEVPQAVANLITRMLAKNVDERPQTMDLVQTALKSAAGSTVDLRVISSHDLRKSATLARDAQQFSMAATQTAGSLADYTNPNLAKGNTGEIEGSPKGKTKLFIGLGLAGAALVGVLLVGKSPPPPAPPAETAANPEAKPATGPTETKPTAAATATPEPAPTATQPVEAAPTAPAVVTPEPSAVTRPKSKKPQGAAIKKTNSQAPEPAEEEPAKL